MAFHMVIKKTSQGEGDNTFVIKNLQSLAIDLSTPLTPMPLPEESDEENILVKMEGNTKTIPMSWTMMEDVGVIGNDFTYSGGVWSLQGASALVSWTALEQIAFWDDFAPASVSDGYTFFIYEDGKQTKFYFKEGSITKVRESISGSSPVVWDAHLDFIVGSTIAAFESNSPERPTITAITAPTSTTIKIDWKTFDGYASGELPSLIDNLIRYKEAIGGTWKTDLDGVSSPTADGARSYTITGLTTKTEYIVKVANENLESQGSLQRNFSFKARATTP